MPISLDSTPNPHQPFERVTVYQEIKDMVQNYHDNPCLPGDDTESAWVSVNELLALISDNKGNGIRIHYGRHFSNHKLYPNRHNVILVSTLDSVNPQNPTSENSMNQLNTKLPGFINTISFSGNGVDEIALCPPSCPQNGPLSRNP